MRPDQKKPQAPLSRTVPVGHTREPMANATLDAGTETQEAAVDSAAQIKAQRECEAIRNKIKSDLSSAVADRKSLLLGQELKMWQQSITDRALEEAGFHTPAEKAKALKQNIGWANANIRESQEWGHQFFGAIERGLASGALTKENAEHARSLALNRSDDWTKVKQFFTGTGENSFRRWQSNWEYMGGLMKDVRAKQEQMKLPNDALPDLKKLRSGSGKFEERMTLAEKTMNELLKLEGKNRGAYREARDLLMGAVTAKALAPGKVDGWLAHIFTKYKGEDAADFIERKLPGFVEDWKDVADEFRAHKKECVARGIDSPTESAFLSMAYEDRRRTTLEMRAKLNSTSVPAEKQKNAGYLKMRIRYALATEDGEMASELTEKLGFEHPDDPDLLSLEEQAAKLAKSLSVKTKAKADQEKPPLPQLQQQIWGFVDRMGDSNMRGLMRTVLNTQDLDKIEAVMQMIYNRYWCRQHGYLNDHIEQDQAKNPDNKEKTKEYAENGHTRFIERNIVAGETADERSIRGENTKAQLIVLSNEESSHNALIKKVEQHKYNKNGGLRYWGTILTTDTKQNVQTFDHTKYFVETLYYPMRTAIRQFFRRGGQYRNRGAAIPAPSAN